MTKSLANILTPLLGPVSYSHLKNSDDLINEVNYINLKNNSFGNLDIKV